MRATRGAPPHHNPALLVCLFVQAAATVCYNQLAAAGVTVNMAWQYNPYMYVCASAGSGQGMRGVYACVHACVSAGCIPASQVLLARRE